MVIKGMIGEVYLSKTYYELFSYIKIIFLQ